MQPSYLPRSFRLRLSSLEVPYCKSVRCRSGALLFTSAPACNGRDSFHQRRSKSAPRLIAQPFLRLGVESWTDGTATAGSLSAFITDLSNGEVAAQTRTRLP